MLEVIILFFLAGVSFIFMLYAIFMLLVKKKKSLKYPLLVSLILFLSLGSFAVYRTVTKAYNKIVNEGDDLIVKSASKTGNLVGKTATAFGKSAYDGAGTVLKNQSFLSPQLKQKGIEVGKIELDEHHNLQVYLIFNKDFKGKITLRVKNLHNEEIGRVTNYVEAKQDETGYKTFLFDQMTDIQEQSKIFIE